MLQERSIALEISMEPIAHKVKPALSDHSKRRPTTGFQEQLSLNAVQKYCRMLQESILQYFRPSLSYHLSLRPLFSLFLSGCLRQVFLYLDVTIFHLHLKVGLNYLLDFFCSGSMVLFTVESLSLLYLLFIS